MQIDHDPNEPERETGFNPWPWVFAMFAVATVGLWSTHGIDWKSALAGGCLAFAASFWAIGYLRYDLFKSWRDTGRDRRP